MVDKLDPKKVSFSLGIVVAIVSIVCALLIAIIPKGTINLFGSIFHGIDLTKIEATITFANAVQGTIVAIVLALIVGWLFAKVYNKLS